MRRLRRCYLRSCFKSSSGGGDGAMPKFLRGSSAHWAKRTPAAWGPRRIFLIPQMQQRQQNAHRLLLIPRRTMDKGKSFTPQPNASRQRQRDFDSSVSVVALAHVHESRQAANGSEVKVVEAVFSAGQRQHHGIGRRLLDKLSIVVPSGTGLRHSRRPGKSAGSHRSLPPRSPDPPRQAPRHDRSRS